MKNQEKKNEARIGGSGLNAGLGIFIEVPKIRREGFNGLPTGRAMRNKNTPEGFVFCPYTIGSTERKNFLAGCIDRAFGVPNR